MNNNGFHALVVAPSVRMKNIISAQAVEILPSSPKNLTITLKGVHSYSKKEHCRGATPQNPELSLLAPAWPVVGN